MRLGAWGACCTLAMVSAACKLTDRAVCALVHHERFCGIQHAGYMGLNNRPRTLLAAQRGLQGMQLSACAASSPALHAKPALYSSARCVQTHAASRDLHSFPFLWSASESDVSCSLCRVRAGCNLVATLM